MNKFCIAIFCAVCLCIVCLLICLALAYLARMHVRAIFKALFKLEGEIHASALKSALMHSGHQNTILCTSPLQPVHRVCVVNCQLYNYLAT